MCIKYMCGYNCNRRVVGFGKLYSGKPKHTKGSEQDQKGKKKIRKRLKVTVNFRQIKEVLILIVRKTTKRNL